MLVLGMLLDRIVHGDNGGKGIGLLRADHEGDEKLFVGSAFGGEGLGLR